MKKICFVFHNAISTNGGTHSLIDIIDYLNDSHKYNICAIFPKEEGTAIDYLKSIGITEIYHYKYGGLMQSMRQPVIKRIVKFPLLLLRWFCVKEEAYRASKQIEEVDMVYSNTSSIVFGGYLGKYLKCKQAWHIREYRRLDHQISFFLGEKFIKRFIDKCSSCIFFVSRGVMEYNLDVMAKEKCFITYNSYSKDFLFKKNCFYDGKKTLNILLAGDIMPSKGQLYAVEAINQLKDYNIKLFLAGGIGDSAYYEEIKTYIADNSLEELVSYLGYRTDMIDLRKQMDVGLCTSTNEAFGRIVIESMLSSMAVIGRNTGGTKEQIEDYKTGVFYDGSSEDLVEKIRELFDNPELLKRLAQNAYDFASEEFTESNSAKIVEHELDKVLEIGS